MTPTSESAEIKSQMLSLVVRNQIVCDSIDIPKIQKYNLFECQTPTYCTCQQFSSIGYLL